MNKKAHLLSGVMLGGLFLFLDQCLKWLALHNWSAARLLGKFLGWKPFFNTGIGFGVPINSRVTIILSIAIILVLLFIVYHLMRQELSDKPLLQFYGLILVVFGALSNLSDRLALGATVDYVLLLTGVINLADVAIVAGFILYLFANFKKEGHI